MTKYTKWTATVALPVTSLVLWAMFFGPPQDVRDSVSAHETRQLQVGQRPAAAIAAGQLPEPSTSAVDAPPQLATGKRPQRPTVEEKLDSPPPEPMEEALTQATETELQGEPMENESERWSNPSTLNPPGRTPVDPIAMGYPTMQAMEANIRAQLDLPESQRLELWMEKRNGREGLAIDIIPPVDERGEDSAAPSPTAG